MTTPLTLANDAVRFKVAQVISKGVTDLAAIKLAAAGRGLSGEVELMSLTNQVADAAVPALVEGIWAAIERHAVAKARGAEAHVYVNPEQVADALVESLDMVTKGDTVAVFFDGAALVNVKLAKANGTQPTVQVDVHVPAAQVEVHNHIPQQPAAAVHLHPAIQAPQAPTRTEIEYETGPDGKQRPKSIHRTNAP